MGNYYWKVYRRPEYFRNDVAWKDLSEEEQNILLYGSRSKGGERIDKKLEGVYNQFKRLVLMKGAEEQTDYTLKKIAKYLYERECPYCKGKRLNTTGLHPADIEKVVGILEGFVERGNTVIVIEHNTDVMKLADYIIDIGPDGGLMGGEVVFTGTPKEMIENSTTITAKYLRK